MLHLSFLKMLIANVLLDDLNHTSGVEYFFEEFTGIIPREKYPYNTPKTLKL
tara:strand:- start:949 stop:1104 length:156 start_codon:yes stop_codon:yes gene_type:complete